MNMLTSAFTVKDNSQLDLGRIIWALMAVAMVGLKVYVVVCRGEHLDEMNFMSACAGLLVAGGVGLKVKQSTESGG